MREKMSLRNIPGICVCAVAALFLAEPLTVLLLLPAFSAGGAGNLSLLPYAFVFVIAGLLFLLFQNKLIPKRKSSRNDFPWTPGVVRGAARNLPPGIDCVNG